MNQHEGFSVTLSREAGYAFRASFDHPDLPPLLLDEPEPLGTGRGPSAARALGAAVGHCLAASLLFCVSKARVDVSDVEVRVDGTIARNPQGRLRVTELRVTLSPTVQRADRERIARCLDLFEDFCIVTGSVRQGIPVHVEVTPADAP